MPNLSLKNNIANKNANSKANERLRENLASLIDEKKTAVVNDSLLESNEITEGSDVFDIGPRLRNAYEAGQLPATHRVLYDSIVRELGDKREGIIIIQRLLNQTRISRNAAAVILKCLNHYGYLKFNISKRRNEGTYIQLS
jgi:hypothetical protein